MKDLLEHVPRRRTPSAGSGLISKRTKRKHRPPLPAASAWLPIVRRNVWVLARRSP
jgi:hypothetical protein